MGTQVAAFENRPQRSAALQQFVEQNANVKSGESTPSLQIEGGKFHISQNGEKVTLMKKDADGDMIAVPTVKVIILDQASSRGRAYYDGPYNPKEARMPDCWSDDMISPAANVPKKQCANCAACLKSAKGSAKTDAGAESVACKTHKMIAVMPAWNVDHEPLRMKLSITSIWDNQNSKNDSEFWFAFDNYCKWLKANGVLHTAEVVTKIKFDTSTQYPKVLFFKDSWTPNEVFEKLMPLIASQKVKDLVGAAWTPNGIDGERQMIAGPEAGPDAAADAAKDVTPDPAKVAADAARLAADTAKAEAKKAEVKAAQEAEKKAAAKAAAKAALAAQMAALEAEDDTPPETVSTRVTPAETAGVAVIPDDDDTPTTGAAANPTAAAASAKAGASKAKATPTAKPVDAKPATAPAGAPGAPNLKALLGAWGDD